MTDWLPPCSWRRRMLRRDDLFFCAHPQKSSRNDLVSPEVCLTCSSYHDEPNHARRPLLDNPLLGRPECVFLQKTQEGDIENCDHNELPVLLGCDHPLHPHTSIYDCAVCHEYQPVVFQGGVRDWAVGVVTAPRKPPTLQRTLQSLERAGWSQVHIFAEPGAVIAKENLRHAVIQRETTLGAWPNWYLGLAELYMRRPWVDAYMMVQDDVVFCRNVRRLLEGVLWPTDNVGVASVYCPSVYRHSTSGFLPVNCERDLVGALTYIFPNWAVRSLLGDKGVVAHRRRSSDIGDRYVDVVVGAWARLQRIDVLYHYPSLAQHTGDHSTVWPGAINQGKRRADSFVGEEFDARLLVNAPSGGDDFG